MTPEEQRIAIAKACGWTHIVNTNTMSIQGIWRGYPPKQPIIDKKELIPDYLNDLNAMHEAEKILTWSQKNHYRKWLECLCRSEDDAENESEWHATASQRAEAFLRTIGKWIQ